MYTIEDLRRKREQLAADLERIEQDSALLRCLHDNSVLLQEQSQALTLRSRDLMARSARLRQPNETETPDAAHPDS